jgi:hypothetical protein
MSAQIDCPICMDCIESTTRNCVTTDCGHCFHTNCLMQSVAHNGFGCPYCRTAMAEVPEEEDSDDEEEDEENYLEDDILRGVRFFWNNVEGVGHDSEDERDEDEMEDEMNEDDGEEDEGESPAVPDAAYVAQKLAERGITFEDLVKNILFDGFDNPFDESYVQYREKSYEVYGQMRAIVNRYNPNEVENATATPQTPAPEDPIAVRNIAVDYEAQPKLSKVSLIRQVSCC